MKHLFFLFGISMILLSCSRTSTAASKSVNPVIGDISYVEKFGMSPTEATDEVLRLRTHLSYVEKLLREKDCRNLNPQQQEKRQQMLDLLKEYYTKGIFPVNRKDKDRRLPCFIDEEGRICAVGYLVQQTAGRKTAEYINTKYQYSELLAMNDATLDIWINNSGLTKEELAMIQPQYNYQNPGKFIDRNEAIVTGLWTGFNLAAISANYSNSQRLSPKKSTPWVGMISGVGQCAFGINQLVSYDRPTMYLNRDDSYMKLMGIFNIVIGSTTAFISADKNFVNREKRSKSVSWNLITNPNQQGGMSLALHCSKSF